MEKVKESAYQQILDLQNYVQHWGCAFFFFVLLISLFIVSVKFQILFHFC